LGHFAPFTTLRNFLLTAFQTLELQALLDTRAHILRSGHPKEDPRKMSQRLVLAYKNFAAHQNISHIGLGVSALNTCKVLRRAGIIADVWPIVNAKDLATRLQRDPATHVVVSAPWIPSVDIQTLVLGNSPTRFAVNCHSNVGFLQADSNGVRLVREAMEVEAATHNFHLAGNSQKFCKWIQSAYTRPCTYLPNLYYLNADFLPWRPLYTGGTLRIGAFGATRPLKNFMSAAGAALEITHRYKANLELWLSAGRTEGGGDTILRSARAMLDGLPNVKLVENGWQSWPKFRQSVGHMHLLLQPSYTESFNMVTADGVAEGVPSVVSHAIDWAPEHWKAMMDDVLDIARVGRYLLTDPYAPQEGIEALKLHNADGLKSWQSFLSF
jgi:hypothetical protein